MSNNGFLRTGLLWEIGQTAGVKLDGQVCPDFSSAKAEVKRIADIPSVLEDLSCEELVQLIQRVRSLRRAIQRQRNIRK